MGRDRVSATTWIALWTVYVVWGSTYLAIRVAVHPSHGVGLPPLLMAGARFTVAGLLMLALTARTRPPDDRPDPMGRKQWLTALVLGIALPFGGNGLVTVAERTVPSGTTALVIATVPIWAALIGAAIGRERLSRHHIAGLTLGFVGIVALVAGTGSGHVALTGLLIDVAAALSWAAGSVWAVTAPAVRRPLVMTGMEMLCGGVVALVVGLATGETGELHLAAVPARAWFGLGYLVVVGSMVAYTAYVWLLANTRLSLVTTYAYVNPVVAVVLGVTLLGETFTVRSAIAMVAVIGGVVLMLRRPEPVPAPRPDAAAPDDTRQDVAA